MPHWICQDSIRLFEASLEALSLAIDSLGSVKRAKFRENSATYAAEVGLIGVSAELAMTACLVQAHGADISIRSSGGYKTFPEILNDFRRLVRTEETESDFLFSGIEETEKHRQELLGATSAFKLLGQARAAGLHAGRGLVQEAAVIQANTVADFLEKLSSAYRIRPYLSFVPRCLLFDKSRAVIVEDLAHRIAEVEEDGGEELTSLVLSVFLVLAETPDDDSEWIEAFERVSIAPKTHDIRYLIGVLETALPGTLIRTTQAGRGIPVSVDPDAPEAVPIAPHFLRRQFNNLQDRWFADIANANGRLKTGKLDLPPHEEVWDVFAIGFEEAGLATGNSGFSAHQIWPFITSSLSVNGTIGPYWFLVNATGDLGQLHAILREVRAVGGTRLKRVMAECLEGIEAIRCETSIPADHPDFSKIILDIQAASHNRSALVDNFDRHIDNFRALESQYRAQLCRVAQHQLGVGCLLQDLLDAQLEFEALKYWANVLANSADSLEDVPAIVNVLRHEELRTVHTAPRKALRRIDFCFYGPPVAD